MAKWVVMMNGTPITGELDDRDADDVMTAAEAYFPDKNVYMVEV